MIGMSREYGKTGDIIAKSRNIQPVHVWPVRDGVYPAVVQATITHAIKNRIFMALQLGQNCVTHLYNPPAPPDYACLFHWV